METVKITTTITGRAIIEVNILASPFLCEMFYFLLCIHYVRFLTEVNMVLVAIRSQKGIIGIKLLPLGHRTGIRWSQRVI